MIQWLGLNALGPGQSLVRELRSCKPHSTAKKKKKNHKNFIIYCIKLQSLNLSFFLSTLQGLFRNIRPNL